MKKALSFVLALVLLLSVSATAFADEPQKLTDTKTVDVWKHYAKTAPAPAETFKFSITPVSVSGNDLSVNNMPSLTNTETSDGTYSVTFDADAAGSSSLVTDGKFTITLPDFSRVGTYTYKIEETSGNTAGVDYDSTTVRLVVTVLTDKQGILYRYVTLHRVGVGENNSDVKVGGEPGSTAAGGTYTPAFTNTFTATKTTTPEDNETVTALSLKKTISGNYADDQQYFDFKVVFTIPTGKTFNGTISVSETSYKGDNNEKNPTTIKKGEDSTYTATFKLKANETLQFGSVPVGMTYNFTETTPTDYTATLSGDCSGTVVKDKNIQAVIDNKRETTTPTGISLDSLPYVIILATVAAAALLIVLKKRAKRA